jgi:hypothetical protein
VLSNLFFCLGVSLSRSKGAGRRGRSGMIRSVRLIALCASLLVENVCRLRHLDSPVVWMEEERLRSVCSQTWLIGLTHWERGQTWCDFLGILPNVIPYPGIHKSYIGRGVRLGVTLLGILPNATPYPGIHKPYNGRRVTVIRGGYYFLLRYSKPYICE